MLDLHPAVFAQRRAEQRVVFSKEGARRLVAESLDDTAGVLDVGEEDRDGPFRSGAGDGELGHEAAGDIGMKQRVASLDGADRLYELLWFNVLHEEAGRPSTKRANDLLVVGEAGQDQHLRVRRRGPDAPQPRDAIDAGHDEVHEDDLRRERLRHLGGLQAVLSLTDDLDVILQIEEELEAVPDDGLVIGDEDADGASQAAPLP